MESLNWFYFYDSKLEDFLAHKENFWIENFVCPLHKIVQRKLLIAPTFFLLI